MVGSQWGLFRPEPVQLISMIFAWTIMKWIFSCILLVTVTISFRKTKHDPVPSHGMHTVSSWLPDCRTGFLVTRPLPQSSTSSETTAKLDNNLVGEWIFGISISVEYPQWRSQSYRERNDRGCDSFSSCCIMFDSNPWSSSSPSSRHRPSSCTLRHQSVSNFCRFSASRKDFARPCWCFAFY